MKDTETQTHARISVDNLRLWRQAAAVAGAGIRAEIPGKLGMLESFEE